MTWTKLKRRLMTRWLLAWDRNRRGVGRASVIAEDEVHFSPEWEEQLAFDAALSRALQSEPVPPGLREAILNQGPRPATAPAWRRPAQLALAASVILLIALPSLLSGPSTFAEYRERVVAEAWTAKDHLDFGTADLSHAQSWIQRQRAPWPTHFPTALGDIPVAGCRVFTSHGQRVTLICFANGMHHTHLFILDDLNVPDRPSNQFPQLATCRGWETASWSWRNQTFILTGLKSMTFLKQFRKERHWSWNG
jgi:hypothetical protein